MASDTIDRARSLLEERRTELETELAQIQAALSGLGGKPAPTKRGPGRPRKSTGPSGKKRRSRRGGTRAEHALGHLSANPGASAPEIAQALGIKPNYVYRVMGELEKDGRVSKRGRGYHAVEAAPAAATAPAEPEAPAASSENAPEEQAG